MRAQLSLPFGAAVLHTGRDALQGSSWDKSAAGCSIWLSEGYLGLLPEELESTGKATEEPRGAVTCLGNVAGVLKVLKATLPSFQACLRCICLFCPLVRLPGQACEPKPFLSEAAPFLAS